VTIRFSRRTHLHGITSIFTVIIAIVKLVWDSSVSIATRLRAGRSGRLDFDSRGGGRNFSVHHPVKNGSGIHPASYPMGTGDSFPGVKRLGREANHSPQSSAEFKNTWTYTSTPPYAFTAWCLVKSTGTTLLLPLLFVYIRKKNCQSP
jgi:hypothetical protein